ncbi:segregation/condensation protein A [bacterium]|nr:segregation/condensation protein A [bacterium]
MTSESPANAEQPDEAANQPDWLAKVAGETLTELPKDLYIPPDALEVFLETFEGPLDLLLYLIRRQNLDILDIPVAQITGQYMQYIGLMQTLRLELAAEYLVMAAMLAEIKSRMLLPRPVDADEEEDDPRAGLVRRLQEYERFKEAAETIESRPRVGRDVFPASARPDRVESAAALPQPDLRDLLLALNEVLARAELFASHEIAREPLSVRERMSRVLERLSGRKPVSFIALIDTAEGRLGVVVCFLAVLELVKGALIAIEQADSESPLTVRLAGPTDTVMEQGDD